MVYCASCLLVVWGSLLTGVCVLSFWVFFGFITTYSRVYLCPVSLLKYRYFFRLFCTFAKII